MGHVTHDRSGVVVDFARFTAQRERHRARRATLANVPSPRIIEGVVVERVEPSLVARPEIDPQLRPGPARRGRPWGADGPRPPRP